MEQLTRDALFALAIQLDLPDLLQYCSTHKRVNDIICKQDHIWWYKLHQHFFNDMRNFDYLHKTPKELYILLWNLRDIKQQLKLTEDIFDIYNMEKLDLSYNYLTGLPANLDVLQKLKNLNLDNNKLTKLPSLPPSLKDLNVSNNELTELPSLPSSLIKLSASDNKLSKLPSLPSSLQFFYVSNNKLTKLPSLPPSLQTLRISGNNFTKDEIVKIKKQYPNLYFTF